MKRYAVCYRIPKEGYLWKDCDSQGEAISIAEKNVKDCGRVAIYQRILEWKHEAKK